ncbi:fungal-specific transcription factor domain-containing protein [Nemania sp. FL0916]|nr:fungal-specific transcription factor domain-containing protein [Nemania sp. FL0916]
MEDSAREHTSTVRADNNNTPATNSSSSSQPPQPAHLRSCILCRQRKVKCDRRQPCSNCVRARAKCVHPPGTGRAAKRPRQAVDAKVLDRLSQLESTITRLQKQAKGRETGEPQTPESAALQESSGPVDDAAQDADLTALELGRLVVDESQSRYVSNVMWAGLTESIDQLRGMFLETNSKDEDPSQLSDSPPFHEADSQNTASLGPNAAILGFRSLAHSLREFHPSLDLAIKLFQLFADNVLPMAHIFHTPSLVRLFWSAVVSLDCLDKETEALLFAIYYSALVSIDPAQCANIVGAPRTTVVERYKFAAEQALARANFLNTNSTLLLQAAVLYFSALRSEDGTRTVWSLIALAVHVARSMGFHRDGTVFNLPPFETEMRRRIWQHICLLDHRSTEYHGYEPTVTDESVFDTRWPVNVNDCDLSIDMTEPPTDSDGATDMIIVHVRCHALRIGQDVSRISRSSFSTRLRLVDEHDKWVAKYAERCDPAQPLHCLAMQICYLAAARIRAMVYFTELMTQKRKLEIDASRGDGSGGSSVESPPKFEPDIKTLREHLFTNSINTLKSTCKIMLDPRLDRWAWHSNIYVQWHTIAFVLSEICIRPPSPQCDKAWEYARAIYNKWLAVKYRDSTEQGDAFAKPMGQLFAKAQRVRETQRAGQKQQQQQQQPHDPTQERLINPGAAEMRMPEQHIIRETPTCRASLDFDGMDAADTAHMLHRLNQANSDSTAATTAPMDFSENSSPSYGIDHFDPWLEMMPEELLSQWLESIAPGSLDLRGQPPDILSTRSFFDFP